MLRSKLEWLCKQILEGEKPPDKISFFGARKDCPDLFTDLSALANSPGGGILIFGLDNTLGINQAELCGVYDVDDLESKIKWQCLEMEPALHPLFTETSLMGKRILSAEIPEIDKKLKPCYHKATGRPHSAFKRVRGSNRLLTEAEIHSYEAYEARLRDELRICEQARWEDINLESVENYKQRLIEIDRLPAHIDQNQLLRMEGLQIEGKPTLAAILLFGYDPQCFHPQFSIMATVYEQNKVRECRRINGTLDMLCEQAIQFVRRNVTRYKVPNREGESEVRIAGYPIDAIREALLNALIHRDYSKYAEDKPVYLWIYEKNIQICSPGGFFGAPDVQSPPSGLRSLRNPKLMEMLETLGALPQENSGLQYMRDLTLEVGLESPEIKVEDDWFSVIFQGPTQENWIPVSAKTEEMSQLERQVWEYCNEPKTLAELTAYFGWKSPYYMRAKLLTEMIDKELLEVVDLYAKQKVQYQSVIQ